MVMSSFWSKVKDFVGFGDPLEYEEDGEEYEQVYREENKREEARRATAGTAAAATPTAAQASDASPMGSGPARKRVRAGNVIGMPNSGVNEVLVIEPRSFEEAPQIVQHLRDRKSVILNLTLMDSDQAQRSVDFVAGATFAIDGHQERVGDGIFLFTPSSVMISTEMPSQLRQANQAFGGNFRLNPEAPRRAQG
jgi:cell division inhibitor SepF